MAVKASASITLFNVMDMDSVEIGGRNLWLNSSFDNGLEGYTSYLRSGSITAAEGHNGHNAVNISRSDYSDSARCLIMSSSLTSVNSFKTGDIFTFSAWVYVETALDSDKNSIFFRNIRSDTGASFDRGIYIPSDTAVGEWTHFTYTWTAAVNGTIQYCGVGLGLNGSILVSEIKVEKGNKPTDWTPAPEDMASKAEVETVETQLANAEVNITQTNEEYVLNALKEYVGTDEYGEFSEEVTAELAALAEEITLKFTKSSERTEEINDELTSRFTELEKYFEFSTSGLTIKTGDDSEIQLVIDNDIISFQKNGTQFGWWDGVDFHTGNIVVDVDEKAQFGNFAFVPRDDGSLLFLKVGE